jgi:hypothetical protein
MPTVQFDILRRHEDGSFLWLETAENIEIAKPRLEELCAQTPGNYFVFDQKSQQIVAKLSPSTRRVMPMPRKSALLSVHKRGRQCTDFTRWASVRGANIVPQSRTRDSA